MVHNFGREGKWGGCPPPPGTYVWGPGPASSKIYVRKRDRPVGGLWLVSLGLLLLLIIVIITPGPPCAQPHTTTTSQLDEELATRPTNEERLKQDGEEQDDFWTDHAYNVDDYYDPQEWLNDDLWHGAGTGGLAFEQDPENEYEMMMSSALHGGSADVGPTDWFKGAGPPAPAAGMQYGAPQTVFWAQTPTGTSQRHGKKYRPHAMRAQKRREARSYFWHYNTSGAPQIRELLEHIRSDPSLTASLGVLAVAEHMQRGLDYDLHREELQRHRIFSLGAAASTGAGGGPSAGVELLTPCGGGTLAPLLGYNSVDVSPPDSPGRLVAGWFLMASHYPILVMESYLWTCEPPTSTRNAAILQRAMELINTTQLYFIWWGDFQCEAEELGAAGWQHRVGPRGARIMQPDSPTCKSGRAIDLAVIDCRLSAGVSKAQTLSDWPARSHRPCFLTLSHRRDTQPLPRFLKPKGFPARLGIGPRRQLTDSYGEATTQLRTFLDNPTDQRSLDVAWDSMLHGFEHRLCQLHDAIDEQGQPDSMLDAGQALELRTCNLGFRGLLVSDAWQDGT